MRKYMLPILIIIGFLFFLLIDSTTWKLIMGFGLAIIVWLMCGTNLLRFKKLINADRKFEFRTSKS